MRIKQPKIKKASSTSLGRKEGKSRNVKPVTFMAEAIHINLLPDLSHPMAGSYRQASLTRIQQMYGNQFVQRMIMMMNPASEALKIQRQPEEEEEEEPIQAKLTISQPGDKYEQEADRVAEAVMRMPEPQVQRQPEEEEEEEELIQMKPLAEQITPFVQRQVEEDEEEEEEELIQTKPLAEQITPFIQRQAEEEEEEEEPLQTKGASGKILRVNPGLGTRINESRGNGQPLSKSVCSSFETRFGHDFSQVRIHTDTQAAESARILKARAFTIGRDVVFGAGQYAPETNRGKRLLAHELTHVVQQKASTSLLSPQVEEALREELPVPKYPPIFGTGKLTYRYAGKKVLKGANAKWVGIPSIKHHIEKKGRKWYGVLDKFHIKAKYWINSKTKWNHIKNFPGGGYKYNFNTPEGSKTHERAELKAVKTLWETAQKNIKAGIKKGFKTKKEAVDNYKKIFNKEMKNFRKKQQAISNHTNPVGPNAEWAYYKKEYAKYKASLKKKKVPKKKTP